MFNIRRKILTLNRNVDTKGSFKITTSVWQIKMVFCTFPNLLRRHFRSLIIEICTQNHILQKKTKTNSDRMSGLMVYRLFRSSKEDSNRTFNSFFQFNMSLDSFYGFPYESGQNWLGRNEAVKKISVIRRECSYWEIWHQNKTIC